MKVAAAKQEFRDNDPCCQNELEWYTFANDDCYNELEGVTVTGVDKSRKTPGLDSSLSKKDNWWNRPIDVSFENPWPEARWDWFEDRQGGDRVYGSLGGGDTGRKLGKNGEIYVSVRASAS